MFGQTTRIYLVIFTTINFISRQIECHHGRMRNSDFGAASYKNKIQVETGTKLHNAPHVVS